MINVKFKECKIGKYQLILPLLDATMFLTQGKTQKYDLSSFYRPKSTKYRFLYVRIKILERL